jgi:hypothetical protein
VEFVILSLMSIGMLLGFKAVSLVHLPEVLVTGVILMTTSDIEVTVGVVLAKGEQSSRDTPEHFYGMDQFRETNCVSFLHRRLKRYMSNAVQPEAPSNEDQDESKPNIGDHSNI